VVLLGLSWAVREQPRWPPEPLALWSWLYLIVFGSLLAFNAYMYLLGHASPAVASSYAFVNPVIALFLGVSFGRESVTGGEWLAAGVVLAGVLLLLRGR
jgi:drug/metabolite transporter (DMT)-like permease